MSDAPMTPSELANKFAGLVSATRASLLGKTEWEYDTFAAEKLITDRDAAIRREAQAEALERAQAECESILESRDWDDARGIAAANLCGMYIHALSPDPNYIPRIVAQAKLEEAEWWNEHHGAQHDGNWKRMASKRLADLARLAADAPKEGK